MNYTNRMVSSDNLGYASYLMEQDKNGGQLPGKVRLGSEGQQNRLRSESLLCQAKPPLEAYYQCRKETRTETQFTATSFAFTLLLP